MEVLIGTSVEMKGKKSNRQSRDVISASPTSATSCLFTFSRLLFTHIWTTATIQAALGTSKEGKKDPGTRIYTTITAFCEAVALDFPITTQSTPSANVPPSFSRY